MTPEMYWFTPCVVNSRPRYVRRFSSVHSTLTDWNRFSQVPADSSAARMPLPGATMAAAVFESSALSIKVRVLVERRWNPEFYLQACERVTVRPDLGDNAAP